jgi:hypothetical protein
MERSSCSGVFGAAQGRRAGSTGFELHRRLRTGCLAALICGLGGLLAFLALRQGTARCVPFDYCATTLTDSGARYYRPGWTYQRDAAIERVWLRIGRRFWSWSRTISDTPVPDR